jgi:peptidoglycan/LPS O-acetylase OafA/YrhL
MSDQNKTHVPVLESLRGFAALSVCLFHFVVTTIGLTDNAYIKSIFGTGKYGVQMFFVISGFILPWSMYHGRYQIKNFFQFVWKRILRLEPPYLVSIGLVLGMLFLREKMIGPNDHIQLSVKQVVLHFGYLIPFFQNQYQWLNNVYWTLAVEFQYYLFIALLFLPLMSSKALMRYAVYAIMIAASFWGTVDFLPFWLPIFALGILLFLKTIKQIRIEEYIIVSIIMFVLTAMRLPWECSLFVLFAVLPLLFFQQWTSKAGNFLGKISYSIYLTHGVTGATVINVISHHISHPLAKVGLVLLGVAVSIAAAYLMYWVVEKPSKQLSSKVKFTR